MDLEGHEWWLGCLGIGIGLVVVDKILNPQLFASGLLGIIGFGFFGMSFGLFFNRVHKEIDEEEKNDG